MKIQFIAILLIAILMSSVSISQNRILVNAQYEDFDGVRPGDPNKIIAKNIISFDKNLTEISNKTEVEEAIEKSYPSEDIIITNKTYSFPKSNTIIPNATLLNPLKLQNIKNESFLECRDCFTSFPVVDNDTLVSDQSSNRFNPYKFPDIMGNLTLPVYSTDSGYSNATSIPPDDDLQINPSNNPPDDDLQIRPTNITKSQKLYNFTIEKIEAKTNDEIIKTLVAEPTIAKNNQTVIFVNNYYMARSMDDGKSWTFLTLNNDYENIDICCDNRIIYDNNTDLFIWYSQGEINSTSNTNTNRLGVSADGISWLMYYFEPSDIRPFLKNSYFDFPHLVAGDKYLYLLTAVASPSYLNGIVIKFPLEQLSKCTPSNTDISKLDKCGVSFEYYFALNKLNFAPIYNVKDTIYWATHMTNDIISIYQWNENSSSFKDVKQYDVNIPSFYTLRKNNTACDPSNDDYHTNWCLRTDSRILTGWKNGTLLGFFWNADYNSTNEFGKRLQFPYIDGVTLKIEQDGLKNIGRPYVYNPGTVFLYPSASVNSDGEVGMLGYYGDKILKPSIFFGTTKNISKNMPWDIEIIRKSTDVPPVYFKKNDTKAWGDFITLQPDGNNWYGTAFVMEGGNKEDNIQPYYIKIEKNNN